MHALNINNPMKKVTFNVKSNTKYQLWQYVEVTCFNLVLVRILKKITMIKREFQYIF